MQPGRDSRRKWTLIFTKTGSRVSEKSISVKPQSNLPQPPPPSQVNQLLEVGDRAAGSGKYAAMGKWAGQLQSIHAAVCNKLS
jgi:hypothetical protein